MLSAEESTALWLSLRVAVLATIWAFIPATALAYLLARRDFPGKWLVNGLAHLPLVMPPVVTGFLLLMAFGRQGWIGHWLAETTGIVFSFRWTGAALASAVMGFPLMVRAIRLSFEAVDPRLEQAAESLGAPAWRRFISISLPLAGPGLLAGVVLCFAKSLGEFGATITFVSSIPGETQTLPAAIYAYTQIPGGDAGAWRLTAVSVAVSLIALALSEWLAERARRQVR